MASGSLRARRERERERERDVDSRLPPPTEVSVLMHPGTGVESKRQPSRWVKRACVRTLACETESRERERECKSVYDEHVLLWG